MPYARKRKVYRKKPMRKSVRRTANRKRRVYRSSPRGMIGFPQTRIVKMRFAQNFVLDSPGAISNTDFSANNLNYITDIDPMFKLPLGYDQWSRFYEDFVVIGSKITVKPAYASVTPGATPLNIGILLQPKKTPILSTSVTSLISQGKSTYRIMQAANNGNIPVLKYSFSPKKFYNVANLKDNFDDLGCTFDSTGNTAPIKEAFYTVWVCAADLAANVEPVNFTVTVDYIVLLRSQRILPESFQTGP